MGIIGYKLYVSNSDVPRQFCLGEERHGKKVTSYFNFDQPYFPEHKETMITIIISSKLLALSQEEG